MISSTYVIRVAAVLAVAFAYLSCDVMPAKAETASGSWVLQKGRGVQFPLARRPELQMQEQQLSGSTGCNAFTAKLGERAEKRIAIELLSLTRKLCGPKESGVENAIVSAFAETVFLEQDGQVLAFLSPSREPLLIWQRADGAPTMRSMQREPVTLSHKHARRHSATTPPNCVSKNVCTPVTIFFGTNRKQEDVPEHVSFGAERDKRLTLGSALVTVPEAHGRGEIERPSYLNVQDLLSGMKEDPSRHFVIVTDRVQIFDSVEEFITEIRSTREELKDATDHAFVFVHGFNVTFEGALYRTAQIAFDLGSFVNGVHVPFGLPFLYTWPSKGTLKAYATDEDSARLAIDNLKAFLEIVIAKSGTKHLHLIAHSMGNQPVLHVLEQLAKDNPHVVFDQIVLAAPDIDKDEFEKIAAHIGPVANGITLYASSNDKAIAASRLLRDGRVRAGDVPNNGPVIVGGVDSIDVSATSTELFALNHDTYARGKAIISDISLLLSKGLHPPPERTPIYEPHQRNGKTYWVFPR